MGGRQGVGSGQTHHPLPAPSRSQGTSCPCDELGESAEHPGGAQDLGREGREREGGQQISRHEAAAQMEGKRRLRRRPLPRLHALVVRGVNYTDRCTVWELVQLLFLRKGLGKNSPRTAIRQPLEQERHPSPSPEGMAASGPASAPGAPESAGGSRLSLAKDPLEPAQGGGMRSHGVLSQATALQAEGTRYRLQGRLGAACTDADVNFVGPLSGMVEHH